MSRINIIRGVVLLAALAIGGWYFFLRDALELPATELSLYGNIDVREIALAFDGTGRVLDVAVEEGDSVSQGDVLATLDTSMLALQTRQAQAQVDAQQQTLIRLQNGAREEEIIQARSRLGAADAQLALATQSRERLERLGQSSTSVTQQSIDQARVQEQVASATVDQLDAALDLLVLGARPEEIAGAQAQLNALKVQLEIIEHQIEQGTLRAPADAIVRARLLEPGDMATVAKPVLSLAIAQPKWVRVYVSEIDLGRVSPGLEAAVISDTDSSRPMVGIVGYISSVAEFTPKAVQTEELRTSLVYEVRVLVEDADNRLRLGQPVTVKLPIRP